jgi:surface polysaccharide O-acyltransferase-like enzyme
VSVMIANFFHRASKCPVACFLKFLSSGSFIYAVHVAAYHQTDMSHYSYFLLVDSVVVIAVLALAFHWSCQFRKVEKKRGIK